MFYWASNTRTGTHMHKYTNTHRLILTHRHKYIIIYLQTIAPCFLHVFGFRFMAFGCDGKRQKERERVRETERD